MRHDIRTRFKVDVSVTKYWKVRQIALKTIREPRSKYFGRLYDYYEEIRRSNRWTTVIIKAERSANGL